MMTDEEPKTEVAEILLRLYEQCVSDRRHLEEQCEKVTSYVVLLAVATLGILKLGETPFPVNVILALVIFLLGWFGRRITKSNCEARDGQRAKGQEYLVRLEKLLAAPSADERTLPSIREQQPSIEDQKAIASIWRQVHTAIMLFACIIAIICLLMHPPSWSWIEAW
jgi:hypothetical protein